jgi:hypothetical protein
VVTNITQHPTAEDKVYCAVVLDVSPARSPPRDLRPTFAPNLVEPSRLPAGGAGPSLERSCTPTAGRKTRARCAATGCAPQSYSGRWAASRPESNDTMIEIFFDTMQRELLDQKPRWATKAVASTIFE